MQDKKSKPCALGVSDQKTSVIADVEGSHFDSISVVAEEGYDSVVLSFLGPIAATVLTWEGSTIKAEVRVSRALLNNLAAALTKKGQAPKKRKAKVNVNDKAKTGNKVKAKKAKEKTKKKVWG